MTPDATKEVANKHKVIQSTINSRLVLYFILFYILYFLLSNEMDVCVCVFTCTVGFALKISLYNVQ